MINYFRRQSKGMENFLDPVPEGEGEGPEIISVSSVSVSDGHESPAVQDIVPHDDGEFRMTFDRQEDQEQEGDDLSGDASMLLHIVSGFNAEEQFSTPTHESAPTGTTGSFEFADVDLPTSGLSDGEAFVNTTSNRLETYQSGSETGRQSGAGG